ncbi:MAG: RnfABCDGE type electron transport complex subunit G [Deltaproteobacteria bacterium]|nr:RnfABCDGE type electron transport complex subunit G [Deltaproteobacteria bacterium]MBW1921951.1 RnfABCDGE type electron transport complex subunit G [Deltaproteobacteria bacterium]MBW1948781.1 RnfABCDGE type electron transport complex subunit G [Deltaproteobacteria bacterium]MBW2006458.1 RnfABCDGE type electron transport complex subunit G [Deltaproteobacteria bacterium]MBW2101154.1 RnfABCDGE type electron transport complex subunit G [Deltaproteobacteria bacterium]
MRDLIKMVVVLTVICACSALVLSFANQATREQREYQVLKYVKEPSIKAVLTGYDNDPIKDRVTLKMGTDKKGKPIRKNIFPAKKGGKVIALAYGSAATGYHGLIEVMVGIDINGKITGVSIMTHTETPGLGARVVEPAFTGQFKGLVLSDALKVKKDGGKIDSVSGATFSSRGVVTAVRQALESFSKIKKEVIS